MKFYCLSLSLVFLSTSTWSQSLDQAAEIANEGLEQFEICLQFETFKELGVPEEPLRQAFYFYHHNPDHFSDTRYITIADYTQNSTQKRFYMLDLETGTMRSEKVSHGSGHRRRVRHGDPDHDGMIDRCHHGDDLDDRTNMTRAGFFKTANLYRSISHEDMRGGVREWPYLDSQNNNGLRMEGLSPDVNDEAMSSGVVMHGAWYNDLAPTMGRSYGCPAFESDVATEVLPLISNGSLYYSYTPRCEGLHQRVLSQIPDWENFCASN